MTTARRPVGSPNVRVKVCVGDHGPVVFEPPNSARTFQCQTPGPSNFVQEVVVPWMPFASFVAPVG